MNILLTWDRSIVGNTRNSQQITSYPSCPGRRVRLFQLQHILEANSYIQTEEEYIKIKSVKLFPAVDNERKITGKGKSIIVCDPNTPMDTAPY
jgi:hypothetical protein